MYYHCQWFELKLHGEGHKLLKQKKKKAQHESLLCLVLAEWIHKIHCIAKISRGCSCPQPGYSMTLSLR